MVSRLEDCRPGNVIFTTQRREQGRERKDGRSSLRNEARRRSKTNNLPNGATGDDEYYDPIMEELIMLILKQRMRSNINSE